MATVYSDASWTGSYTYTRVRVDYSGTSATAILLYTRTNTYSGATGSGSPAGFHFGGGWADMSNRTFYGQQTDAEICRCGFSISMSGGSYSGYTDGQAGYLGFSGSVSIPAQYTPPTGLSVSITEKYTNGAKFSVSVSSYGNPSSASGRYIEAGILGQNTYGNSYRYATASNTSSASITVTNSSSTGSPALSIQPNKEYYYGAYASNTQRNTSKVQGTFVTLAEAPTLTINTLGETDVVISYATTADGNKYTKNVQYSLDGGATWVTGATVSTGSASTGTFAISGLTDDTNYTLKCRVNTTSGNTNGTDITFRTLPSFKLYGSVGGQTKKVTKLYGSVGGQTKEIKKLYASVGGVTKRVF